MNQKSSLSYRGCQAIRQRESDVLCLLSGRGISPVKTIYRLLCAKNLAAAFAREAQGAFAPVAVAA